MSQQTVPEWARLPVGTGPVGIAILDLDKQGGLDIVVLNTKPSDIAASALDAAIDSSKGTIGSPQEAAQLETLKSDLRNLGTVSVLYGVGGARFYPAFETVMYREVAVNRIMTEGILRAEERLSSTEPACMVVANKDSCEVLVLNNSSPYVFNLKGAKLDDVSLVNLGTFTETQKIEDLQFPLGDPSMAVGEFGGDGKIDLVIANNSTYALTIYKGDGKGIFFKTLDSGEKAKMKEWSIGGAGDDPRFVAVGDLNGDGKDDLVVARGGILSRNVSAFLSNGDGTFSEEMGATATQEPRSVAIADFDRDGVADLIVAGVSNLVFLKGNGDGTFSGKQPIGTLKRAASIDRPVGMLAADFNRDGNMDLAVANAGNDSVDMYLGTGGGTFSGPASIVLETGSLPIALATGDLDGDGDLDLAVALFGANEVAILLNQEGRFERWWRPRAGFGACALVVGEFDGQGWPDIAIARKNRQALNIATVAIVADSIVPQMKLVQKLSVTLEQEMIPDSTVPRTPFEKTYQVVGAGDIAILAGGTAKEGLALLASETPDGSFKVVARDSSSPADLSKCSLAINAAYTGLYPASLAWGDLKAESSGGLRQELAVAALGANGVWVWNPKETNASPLLLPRGTTPQDLSKAQDPNPILTWVPSLSSVGAVTVADFTGDGKPDLAVSDFMSDFKGDARIYLISGNGAGTFQGLFDLDGDPSSVDTPDRCDTGAQPTALAAGDFDADGRQDLAVANFGSDDVSILMNQGGASSSPGLSRSPTFRVHQTLAVGTFPTAIVAGDFDKDGDLDLAVSNFGSNDVSVLLNDGTGAFRLAPSVIPVGPGPIALALGYAVYVDEQGKQIEVSLNQDAIPDLVVANFLSNDVSVLVGDGTGAFQERRVKNAIYNAMKVTLGGTASIAAAGNGPAAVGVGFFDDAVSPNRSLDIAFALEFPNNRMQSPRLQEAIAKANAITVDKLSKLWQDVLIVYGPLELEDVAR
jgi:hypothetical protein